MPDSPAGLPNDTLQAFSAQSRPTDLVTPHAHISSSPGRLTTPFGNHRIAFELDVTRGRQRRIVQQAFCYIHLVAVYDRFALRLRRFTPNMNVLLSPQPHVLPHYHESPRQSPQRGESPLHAMSNRKRKADDDGDEAMSTSPSISHRPLARPSKKVRNNDALGRSLRLPRLLETLDADQLRTVLQHICEQHREIGQEVESQAPRPSVECAINVLQGYQDRLKAAAPYGDTSPEYTYHRVRENLLALLDALSDFTPQFLPPIEMQASLSLQFLDAATNFIHELPDLELQTYRHHKENAYDEISKAWALVINEASKKAGGFNLHSSGWDATLNRHNSRSNGRLATAVAAMGQNVGWIKQNAQAADQNSILNQLMSGSYGSPVRVGPW